LRHEPAHFRAGLVPPGPERHHLSRECHSNFFGAVDNIFLNNQPEWSSVFTAEQINSYLQEDFIRTRMNEKALPEGVSEPRVAIENDRLRLSFRYGKGICSTVVSIDLRVWLVARESNVVAVELLGLHAGAVPWSTQSLLDYITESCHQLNLDVTWYRNRGNPVALLRWQAGESAPRIQLCRLDLQDGQVTIAGRSLPEGGVPSPAAVAFNGNPGAAGE
jgi:hypothetical protein